MKPRHRGRKSQINAVSARTDFMLNIMFIFISILCIAPLLLVIAVSLTPEVNLTLDGYRFFPKAIDFKAYSYVMSDYMQVLRGYGISTFVTLVGSLLSVLITALLAYPISRKGFKYRNQFSFIIFFTMLFNGGLVPWYMVYSNLLHLRDSIWVLIIPMLVSPFYVLIMRTFFTSSIPDSIVESAKIDGAGNFRTFFQIVMPLSKSGLATIGLFSTLAYWNDWYLSLIFISNSKLVNLQYLMYRVQINLQFLNSDTRIGQVAGSTVDLPAQSARMAMCIIGIGPIVFAYPFFQRYIIKGLTVGAIKG